ncbi:hypothetical protein [Comamonas odontotermitis]|uniref:hypothetical protein n=1 Tax=Comamonas odontotermitis TaxID=379895 RepID=UPI001CC5927C|nr:hypothetical protein [Comamonas odontotermitis]UBB15450.1 hypothetical protein LAD35_11245 [Comamonas odontotermitis]
MKTEIINVTPAMAATWLSCNSSNRTLRRSTVEGLKAAFKRGEYVPTHQGIAFSTGGVLLDGQHRLTAISELRDGSFPMLVTRGLSDEAFKAMDIGVKRTAADALRSEDRRLVETARLIAAICVHNKSSVTPTMLIPIIENIKRHHDALLAFCPTAARTWSSAPVRLAAVMSMKNGVDVDYVRSVYRSLVMSHFDAMPPVAQSLYRSHVDGRIRASDTADMLSRCLIAFSPEKAKLTKVQIKDSTASYSQVRVVFGWTVQADDAPEKKKAARGGAAKGVMQSDFRTDFC